MAGIYIHIPFCKRKCSYCDFYSVAKTDAADDYVSAIIDELNLRANEINLADVATIYIGGGTPSVLNLRQMALLMDGLRSRMDFGKVTEVTMEVNPDDVTADYMSGVKSLGVNRISMGVQSFVDPELRAVNRRHNAEEAISAIDTIRNAGISNISVDLIYGLPGQTLESWSYSLNMLLQLDVQHVSAYNLSYEEGTALTRLREMGKITEVDEDTCVVMYELLCAKLAEAGYEHYEISNFARPGYYSRHNSSYWDGTPFLGLGAAAHSFDGKVRRYNPSNLKDYLASIAAGHVAYEAEQEEWWQMYNEMVMVALRTMWGIDSETIARRFGEKMRMRFEDIAQGFVEKGLMQKSGSSYKIAEKGMMMSDTIIRELMYVED